MINSHQFQQVAKQFRAGRISLKEFTDLVICDSPATKSNEEPGKPPSSVADEHCSAPEKLARLPQRPIAAHKGDFGRVLVIGGSSGMAGAVSLTGVAALRSGSGLVKIVLPEMIQDLVASFNPCLMTVGVVADGDYFHGSSVESLAQHTNWSDVVAIGPGMGRSRSLDWIMQNLYPKVAQPMVVDADGLNVLADAKIDLAKHEGMRILTPHPGEFQRLAGTRITNREQMESAAKQMAKSTETFIVLKGNRTYVTDGTREYRNETGNPGMATAGSGDVLTGVITSLIGQGLAPFEASCLGVHVHGAAGDFAAEVTGETSLIATDIVEQLAAAFKKHAHGGGATIGFN